MNKKIMDFLNQPFVLWFMSSVLISFISWQYTETQKNNSETKAQQQVVNRASLELRLLLADVKATAVKGETLLLADLNAIVVKMQYNAINQSSHFYFPSLQNVMLELDSRINSQGLKQFQKPISKYITQISHSMSRLWGRNVPPNGNVYMYLTVEEREGLIELSNLIDEIELYYTKYS